MLIDGWKDECSGQIQVILGMPNGRLQLLLIQSHLLTNCIKSLFSPNNSNNMQQPHMIPHCSLNLKLAIYWECQASFRLAT